MRLGFNQFLGDTRCSGGASALLYKIWGQNPLILERGRKLHKASRNFILFTSQIPLILERGRKIKFIDHHILPLIQLAPPKKILERGRKLSIGKVNIRSPTVSPTNPRQGTETHFRSKILKLQNCCQTLLNLERVRKQIVTFYWCVCSLDCQSPPNPREGMETHLRCKVS